MNKIPTSGYTIRFADCDLFGHLNNARYLDYFLHAREEHLQEAYGFNFIDYYKNGLSWLVGGHQITYLNPAAYQEKIKISSMLIQAEPNSLLVEMQMTDEKETHLKSLLWTRFIPVNIRSGKRENHPEDFMAFVKSIEVQDVDLAGGYDLRLRTILGYIKQNIKADV